MDALGSSEARLRLFSSLFARVVVLTAITQGAFRPWGFPLASWAFAIRIWIAATVALYVSFWLQLEAPYSAMLTVALLAEPTRGQALEKAAFRLIATIIGVAASIAITGLFSQTRDLLLVAFAIWLGLCVYVSGLLDGNRAYAAVLSGYTVAFIAVTQIDNPGHVFESSMARGAAIIIGILSVTIVNDLLSAPDRHPKLAAQLADLHRRIRDCARPTICGGAPQPVISAGLIAEIVALRPEIASLAVESSDGPVRAAAARNMAAALVAELHAARLLNALPGTVGEATCEMMVRALERAGGELQPATMKVGLDAKKVSDRTTSLAWTLKELLRRDEQVRQSLSDLRTDKRPRWRWRMLMYRSHQTAAESGIRAGIWFALAALFFVNAGWPAASASFSFVGVIIGMGATAPNPRTMTAVALMAAPIAAVLVGILEFFILDGVTDFPLLVIGFAPFVVGTALLMTSSNRLLSALGRLNLIFVITIFSPNNPQTYDPQSYLFSFLFDWIAVGLLFAVQFLVPPVSDDRRRQRLVASARQALDAAARGGDRRYEPEEEMFRDAVRIAHVMAAGGAASKNVDTVEEVLSHSDQSSMIRLCHHRLRQLVDGPLSGHARAALAKRDPQALRAAAGALRDALPGDPTVADLSAALLVTSDLIQARLVRSTNLREAAE